MRKILLFISLLSITSCEKVIDIDLSFSNENYVIDAKINKHVNSKSGFSEVLISITNLSSVVLGSGLEVVAPGYNLFLKRYVIDIKCPANSTVHSNIIGTKDGKL